MIYFPQLFSGASGQFPMGRQRCSRTVINQSCEGYQVKLADPGAAITEWNLKFEELTDEELASLQALFQTVEGCLTPFTFLDPADNLLDWSEEQDQAVWQADALLALTGGVADPMGGSAAYQATNTTQATLKLQQSINAPASLNYCLSLYARSDQCDRLWLVRGLAEEAVAVGPQWMRLSSAGQTNDSAEFIAFGIALDPGTSVDVFGFQVEAQTSPSLYKRTAETGGVYPNARFKDDTFTVTTVGPSRHSCEVGIVNVEHL